MIAAPREDLATMMDLREKYTRFGDLLTVAEARCAVGDFPAAAGLAKFAAHEAFPGHAGLFGSPRLESLLTRLAEQISVPTGRSRRPRGGKPKNILHVLTYARPIGGDSRFVWRWIEQDREHRHSVAITSQTELARAFEIPEGLKQVAISSGGFLRALNAPSSKPLEQARELRELCLDADLVVLHLYPFDIVPMLALASGCDSVPVAFINHSDHTFWIGASVANLVVHLRSQSPDFLRSRRGLKLERSSILPIPLVPPPAGLKRVEAKRALGISPETVILLTVATGFKFAAPGRMGFLELVTPVILQFSQVVLLAVGPEANGQWQEANLRTNGRIVALGMRWDNDVLYAAADVYLDSVPFSSNTSALEAGLHGLPILACDPPNPELELLSIGAPGFEGGIELPGSPATYRRSLERLIRDEEFRRSRGEQVRTRILSLHMGGNWLKAVNDIYEKLETSNGDKCLIGREDFFSSGDLDMALARLYSHLPPANFRRQIQDYLGALPYRSRLAVLRSLHQKGFPIHPLNLLPPPIDAMVRGLGRTAKAFLRRKS